MLCCVRFQGFSTLQDPFTCCCRFTMASIKDIYQKDRLSFLNAYRVISHFMSSDPNFCNMELFTTACKGTAFGNREFLHNEPGYDFFERSHFHHYPGLVVLLCWICLSHLLCNVLSSSRTMGFRLCWLLVSNISSNISEAMTSQIVVYRPGQTIGICSDPSMHCLVSVRLLLQITAHMVSCVNEIQIKSTSVFATRSSFAVKGLLSV